MKSANPIDWDTRTWLGIASTGQYRQIVLEDVLVAGMSVFSQMVLLSKGKEQVDRLMKSIFATTSEHIDSVTTFSANLSASIRIVICSGPPAE